MDHNSIYLALCQVPEAKRQSILTRAVADYAELLAALYNDIYESCIKVYYGSYEPKKYQRHGDKAGFNLYSGFSCEVQNMRIAAATTPDSLLSYRRATKEEVLNNVMNGQRGSKMRRTKESGLWPKSWTAKYPNSYSDYSIWSSNADTIDGILRDFVETAGDATANYFWEYVANYI